MIEVEAGCAGEVSATYFSDMANILAVMLLALGVELNFGRRTGSARDLGRRVAPVLTMALLCVGLALSFAMLIKADLGRLCGLGAVWHECISFVVTTQALAIGLSTLVWLMVGEAMNRPGTEGSPAYPGGVRSGPRTDLNPSVIRASAPKRSNVN